MTEKNKQKKDNTSTCYEIMLHLACNARCLFCSQSHEQRSFSLDEKQVYKSMLLWAKQKYGMLWFTGWEPLIHPKIIDYIRFAKKVGFEYIRVQTNGISLYKESFVKKLVNAGVTLFKISAHSHIEKIHDQLVWIPWAFNKLITWIDNVKALGARLWVNLVVTKHNYSQLSDTILFFLEKWITDFVIILPVYENNMLKEWQNIGVRFIETRSELMKIMKMFDILFLKRPLILNFPLCLWETFQNNIISWYNWTVVTDVNGSQNVIDDSKWSGKKRIALCKNCKHKDICLWVDENYLSLFWENEFINIPKEEYGEYDFSHIDASKFLTEDEICFLEILKIKNPATIDDILEIKDQIQICKDCDSVNKIIATGNILVDKWIIKREYNDNKVYYERDRNY